MRERFNTPLPWNWFMRRPGYRAFMAREATSVAIAAYLIHLLVWLRRLGQGPEEFEAAMAALRSPLSVVLHVLVLGAAIYHSITWFNLTPKIMPMYLGEERVADAFAAIAMGYLPWAVVTAAVVWGVMR